MNLFKNIDYISISLDSIYDLNFNKIINGIVCLRDTYSLKNKILINCVINKKNLESITNLINLINKLELKISFEPVYNFYINDHTNIYFNLEDKNEIKRFSETIKKIIFLKKKKYPIINSTTYLNIIKNFDKKKYKCKIGESILSIDNNGYIYNCRIHNKRIFNVLYTKNCKISKLWKDYKKYIINITKNCYGCYFFGYLETTLLLNWNIESLYGYHWK